MDYQELAIEHYSNFVSSDEWVKILEGSEQPQNIIEVFNRYGIGARLLDNGDYDYECGELLGDIPQQEKELIHESEGAYDLALALAEGFSDFVKEMMF